MKPTDRRAAWAWRAYALLEHHAQHSVGRDDDLVCRIAARRLMGRPGVARRARRPVQEELMAARRWTDDQRTEALRIGRSEGWAEAHRQTGIPRATIASWARRQGVQTNVVVEREAAVETSALQAEQRRLDLADAMLGDITGLRGRLFTGMTYVHIKTEGLGEGRSVSTRVEVDMDMPVPADQLRLVQAIGTLVDKVQLLTGQATERVDLTGEYDLEAELRAYQQGMADRDTVKP